MAFGHDQPLTHYQFTMEQMGDPHALVPHRGMMFDPHARPFYKQGQKPPGPGWVNPDLSKFPMMGPGSSNDDYRQRLAAALMGK